MVYQIFISVWRLKNNNLFFWYFSPQAEVIYLAAQRNQPPIQIRQFLSHISTDMTLRRQGCSWRLYIHDEKNTSSLFNNMGKKNFVCWQTETPKLYFTSLKLNLLYFSAHTHMSTHKRFPLRALTFEFIHYPYPSASITQPVPSPFSTATHTQVHTHIQMPKLWYTSLPWNRLSPWFLLPLVRRVHPYS